MIGNKIKWSAGLALVIILILATNFIDRNNFQRIQDSVVSIYEDRLVVKSYIFDIQHKIHEKELLLAQQKDSVLLSQSAADNKELNELIQGFSNTKLTRDERGYLTNLEEQIALLFEMEAAYGASSYNRANSEQLKTKLTNITYTLNQLSDIQITEGKRQLEIGKQAMASIELITQLEIWLMIAIGIVIQVIILYNPKKKKEKETLE
jgi:hypothetical protein